MPQVCFNVAWCVLQRVLHHVAVGRIRVRGMGCVVVQRPNVCGNVLQCVQVECDVLQSVAVG